jgi:hypothetical protein
VDRLIHRHSIPLDPRQPINAILPLTRHVTRRILLLLDTRQADIVRAIPQEHFAAPEHSVFATDSLWLAAEVSGSVDVGCLVDDVGPSKATDIHAHAIVQVAMPADCLASPSDWKSSEGGIACSRVG